MHASSFENMQKCVERFLLKSPVCEQSLVRVLDVGGANVNGSYRDLFPGAQYAYQTADIAAENVDIVLADPYHLPFPDDSIDLVLSGQMLEHCERFWLAFAEMVRVLAPAGFIFLIAPSAGPIHRYPVDCYRFYPDAFAALAHATGCRLEACWLDERGPWRDLVGVFRKTPMQSRATPAPGLAVAPQAPVPAAGDPAAEGVPAAPSYLEVLQRVHAQLQPSLYLEIGVRHGRSLALASCPAIGVDPAPDLQQPLPPAVSMIQATSDDFFEQHARDQLSTAPGLAFIDGLHLFEYALRDFMHIERWSAPHTLVVVDDIFPNHPLQARRGRVTRVWCGDVWKLYQCLAEQRPDLVLVPLDSAPCGTLLVAGLDRDNRTLWERYNPLVRQYREQVPETPPESILARTGALPADWAGLTALLQVLRSARHQSTHPARVQAALRQALGAAPDPLTA
ncbi:MAG: methyltransferase domain-containing protein [Chromatiaceae bacterium]|nr:MAG: methyltransferase domain-containing protein [Chromatiaceae bacterium]